MSSFRIDLGPAESLVHLFSYPNKPGSAESLATTIRHWFDQMIARDGFAAQATTSVSVDGSDFYVDLNGPDELKGYVTQLPLFLKHGGEAIGVINQIKDDDQKTQKVWPDWFKQAQPLLKPRVWDPLDRGNWRFFLPLGMAMLNQKAVNFFHYPPMRLLDAMRDYLDDPVPVRLIELMKANGMTSDAEAWLFSTVMDGCPIAAPDDEGTIYYSGPKLAKTPDAMHLLPIERFHDYQRAQTELLLGSNATVANGFTIPIVVYGTPARDSFNQVWPEANLKIGKTPAKFVEILRGKKTAVLCSGHPYAFFAQAQTQVGTGEMKPEMWGESVQTMIKDLAVVRWQMQMADDTKADPAGMWNACLEYWQGAANRKTVYQLVLHQGSLWYPDPKSLNFGFRLSMKDVEARAEQAAT
jgi:hypothetical protein